MSHDKTPGELALERRRALEEDAERAPSPSDVTTSETEEEEEEEGADGRPGLFYRLDLGVIIAALAVLAVGSLGYHSITAPAMVRFQKLGLEFRAPGGWAKPIPVDEAPTQLARELESSPGSDVERDAAAEALIHEIYTYASDSSIRLEVRVDAKPATGYSNLRRVLSFARHNRYGELYRSIDESNSAIAGRDWLRARFEYAYKAHEDDSPKVSTGVEYAAVGGERLYVVTMHGARQEASWLESSVAATLRIPDAPGKAAPLPLSASGDRRDTKYEPHIRSVLPSVVMILAVDLLDGELRPVAGGSGTIVSPDGSVLTNYHVIYDQESSKPHDLFIIGRIRGDRREPEFDCAGHPLRAKWDTDLDLALIKCDMDMNGWPWTPRNWPAARVDTTEEVVLGERIWVVGYPDTRESRVHVTTGEVQGSTREAGSLAFIRTNASITHGSSGGAVIDERGVVVGVASAFRLRTRVDKNGATPAGRVGMVRPIARARALLEVATRGWTPTEGQHSVAPASDRASDTPPSTDRGVVIASTVRDAANDRPIAGAVVTVFVPGIDPDDVDLNHLQEQALAWGQTNSDGNFTLRHRVARGQTYTVAVTAKGYRTLVVRDILTLGDASPEYFDPWGFIRLER